MTDDEPFGLASTREDVRGDRDNLGYGSLEKSAIPRYRIAGQGFVIGLGRNHRIRVGSSKGREIVALGSDSSRRLPKDSLLATVPRPRKDVFRETQPADDSIKRQASYISVHRSRHASKRRKLSSGYEHPFSIVGPASPQDWDSAASSSDNESSAEAENAYESFKQDKVHSRHRQLLKKTAICSDDLDAWLSLIEHQQALMQSLDADNTSLSASQRRTLIELRLSLFEQALSKTTSSAARRRLTEGFLREGAKIWDTQRQHAEWQKRLNADASFTLRIMHLNFLSGSLSTFSYDECLKSMNEYLSIYVSQVPSIERDYRVIYLFLRATLFMYQAGHSERAIALWQAILEINFFGPQDHQLEDLIASFEDFWDSEVARIGEPTASGWMTPTSTVSHSGGAVPQNTSVSPTRLNHSVPDIAWAKAEQQADQPWPARTVDDVDDPFVVVMFPDIKPWLFKTLPTTRNRLLDAFLCFCSLPQTRPEPDWAVDKFLLQPDKAPPPSGEFDNFSLFAPTEHPAATFHNLESDTVASLATNAIHQLALARHRTTDLAVYALALELRVSPNNAKKLAKRLLKQDPEDSQLYNAYALVESRLGNTAAAERIWATLIEQKSGTTTGAAYVLSFIHTWIWEVMLQGQHARAVSLLALIANPEAEISRISSEIPSEELIQGQQRSEEHIRNQLSRAYSQNLWEELVVCADLLALLAYYSQERSIHAALATYQHVLSMTGLSLDPIISFPQPKARAIQLIHIHCAHLIRLHTSTPSLPFRPRSIITTLSTSTTLFPTNTYLRDLHHTLSTKHGSIDRLRDLTLSSSTPPHPTHPHTILRSITAELHRPASLGGTRHAIRAAFVRAKAPDPHSADSPLRHCPAVHLAHVRWELGVLRDMVGIDTARQGRGGSVATATTTAAATTTPQQGATRAGELVTREQRRALKQQRQRVLGAWREAVAACPWVKGAYLAVWDEVLVAMGSDGRVRGEGENGGGELEEVWREAYQSMIARGLRVRVECAG